DFWLIFWRLFTTSVSFFTVASACEWIAFDDGRPNGRQGSNPLSRPRCVLTRGKQICRQPATAYGDLP
ncbi:MAG TPA: hypothetical protein VD811_03515, partial [Desulfuromonadales bacterium]|nr:hypothetical protein [Desulfuromonadales bacterium]